jgi:hypothetical protein
MNDELEKRKFQRLECPLEGTIKIVPIKEVPNNLPPLHNELPRSKLRGIKSLYKE